MAKRSVDILIRGHDRVSKHFRSAGKSSDFLNTRLRRLAMSAAGLAAGFIGVRAIMRGLGEALRFGDELAKTSQKLGTTTEGLAKLRYAGELTGVAIRTMDMGIQRMTRRLAEAAQGTGEAKAAIAELGLNAKSLAAMAPDRAFGEIAAAMAKVPAQADRVRLSFKLFDSEGVALVNTLALGEEGLQKAGEQLQKVGGVYSAEALAKLEELKDAITELNAAMKALSTQALIAVAGHLEGVANAATKTVTAFNNMSSTIKSLGVIVAGTGFSVAGLAATAKALKWVKEGAVLAGAAIARAFTKAGGVMGGWLLKLEEASLIFSAKTFSALLAPVGVLGVLVAGIGVQMYALTKSFKQVRAELPMSGEELEKLGWKIDRTTGRFIKLGTIVERTAKKFGRAGEYRPGHVASPEFYARQTRRMEEEFALQQKSLKTMADRKQALLDEILILQIGRRQFEMNRLIEEVGQDHDLVYYQKKLNALKDIQKAQEALARGAKSLIDSLKTPFQLLAEEFRRIREYFVKGLIDERQMEQAFAQARKRFGRRGTTQADRPYTGVAAFESRFLTRVPGVMGRDPNVAIQKNTAESAKTAKDQLRVAQQALLEIKELPNRLNRDNGETVEIT